MNWYVFTSVALISFLCGVHAVYAMRFKEAREIMADAGVGPVMWMSPVICASVVLMLLVNINLIAFLIFFGIKHGWGRALLTVLGAWSVSFALFLVSISTAFYSRQWDFWHKTSWLALPLLSVGLWLILYGVI